MGMGRRWLLGTLTAAILVVGPPVGAKAAGNERFRFDQHFSYVVKRYCGDIRVRIEGTDTGSGTVRLNGRGALPLYTVNHHGGLTVTNLATGKAVTFTWNYLEQELSATDNGDGTVSVVLMVPGPEKTFGPDGEVILFNGGNMRLLLTVDYGGTLGDGSDDVVVDERLISSNGGPNMEDVNYCAELRRVTA